jgi:Tfp pilus assembly protein PilV
VTVSNDASPESGFSLLEVLIAIPLASVVVLGVASLFTLSLSITHDSRDTSLETWLAAAKVEELMSMPPGAASLAISPADALTHDEAGYSEHLDSTGAAVQAGQSAFIRRWTVRPSELDGAVLVFRVLVTTPVRDRLNRGMGSRVAGSREVVLVTSRTN